MTKIFRNILVFGGLLSAINSFAQSTTSSPYSQIGLGLLRGSELPQNKAIGGISAGLRNPTSYSSLNIANPASYSSLRITTFDVGLYSSLGYLSKGDANEQTFDASLNHLVFGIPVTKTSALSFGLMPYSSKGYNFITPDKVDGKDVNYVYSGDGGLSKFYIGYGLKLGKNLSIGANASYLFGKLKGSRAAEYDDLTFLNTRTEASNSISGLTFDYGVQYATPLSKRVELILGYAGSYNSKLNSRNDILRTRYYKDASGAADVALDTIGAKDQFTKTKIEMPMMHNIGFTIQRANKWLVGADVSLGQWENYRNGNADPGLQNSMGIAVGGQITPDITSVGNYLKLVDYRFGAKYNKTYINLNNNDVKEMALTLGLGLPLPSNRSTFYKINLGAELGQRGSLNNNMVRERFVNIFLGFTMNDQWFQKYKFD